MQEGFLSGSEGSAGDSFIVALRASTGSSSQFYWEIKVAVNRPLRRRVFAQVKIARQ